MQTITIQFEDNEGDAVSIGIDELVRSGVPLDDNGNSKKLVSATLCDHIEGSGEIVETF